MSVGSWSVGSWSALLGRQVGPFAQIRLHARLHLFCGSGQADWSGVSVEEKWRITGKGLLSCFVYTGLVPGFCTARCQKGGRGRPSTVAAAAGRPSTASQSPAERSAAAACSRSLEARRWVLHPHRRVPEEKRPALAGALVSHCRPSIAAATV